MSIIIEHPTRGTLREWDGVGEDRSFRWSWSGSRNDPEKAHQFASVADARAIFDSMPARLRAEVKILRWDGSRYLEPEERTIPYDANATHAPDRNGQPVTVGDFIRDREGIVWRVVSLALREAYDGSVSKRNGLLDRQHSHFRVERPADISEPNAPARRLGGLEPTVETGIGLLDAVLIPQDDELAAAFERQLIANSWKMIDYWEGRLAAKRSELNRRAEALR